MRSHLRGGLSAALIVVLLCAAQAGADTSQLFLQPRMTRGQLQELVNRLELGADQRLIVELTFTDYAAAMADLSARADADADEAGRRDVSLALAGRLDLAPQRLRELQTAMLQAYQRYWTESDAQLQGLLESVEAMAPPGPATDRAFADLYRELWLEPRREARFTMEYAGDGVDVARLVEEARGGELEALDEQQLEPILATYAQQAQALLMQDGVADRAGRMALRVARIGHDAAEIRAHERGALERWQRMYELNSRTADRIEQLAAAELSPDAASAWHSRFQEACWPWLLRDARPDYMYEWMIGQGNLSEGQRQQADAIYERYRAEIQRLADEAIALMIRTRIEQRRIVQLSTSTTALDDSAIRAVHEHLLRNSGDRSRAAADAGAALEALLSSEQRRRMKRVVR